ncbi:hypothetical protein P43SY_003435 [Pythium insidiosum]|uniref:B9 domain-containing protein 2 n=1 Tax=Pythium insidiosum TaxID=114742 RepID=A0AAD5Q4S7_PYTIN|nr:hypothetical protein P43SY_003435 [Pythium insidiosum]
MLRKLGSPRKGSRQGASRDKEPGRELSALAGVSEGVALAADAKPAPESSDTGAGNSSSKKKKSKPPPPVEDNQPPSTSAPASEPKTEEPPRGDTSGRRASLRRSPRSRFLLESSSDQPQEAAAHDRETKPGATLVRTPRSRELIAENSTSPDSAAPASAESPAAGKDEKRKKKKRDSLSLKALTKRDKPRKDEHGEQRDESKAESKATRSADNASKAKDVPREEVSDTPDLAAKASLSPIRRRVRQTDEEPTERDGAKAPTSLVEQSVMSKAVPLASPALPPLEQPEVHIIGEIVGGDGFGVADGLCCKWSIEYGNQWIHIAGDQLGQTQVDHPSPSIEDVAGTVVWAHPLDVHFATSSFQGWPKVLVQVWRVDAHMKASVIGYGFAHLPFQAGNHQLTVPIWRPMGSSKEEAEAALLGNTPELMTDDVVFNTAWAERCRLRTVASGRPICIQERFGNTL